MIDWTVVASLGTAAGTALLAVATFASTRSANRSARSAERALLEGLRPILMPSQWDEPVQKVHFMDDKWIPVRGGRATMNATDLVLYLGMSVHNAGRGLAVLHGWYFPDDRADEPAAVTEFHRLTRDIYIAANSLGFGQIAIRDPADPNFTRLTTRIADSQPFWIDILYGDAEATQRIITRFFVSRVNSENVADDEWALSVSRHWNLDLPVPR